MQLIHESTVFLVFSYLSVTGKRQLTSWAWGCWLQDKQIESVSKAVDLFLIANHLLTNSITNKHPFSAKTHTYLSISCHLSWDRAYSADQMFPRRNTLFQPCPIKWIFFSTLSMGLDTNMSFINKGTFPAQKGRRLYFCVSGSLFLRIGTFSLFKKNPKTLCISAVDNAVLLWKR